MKKAWSPKFDGITLAEENHEKLWREGMDWVRIEIDMNTLKEEFVNYATAKDMEGVDQFRTLPAWHYATIGRMAYLMNRGAEPSGKTTAWLNARLAEILSIEPANDTPSDEEDKKISAYAKRTIDYVDLYSFIEAVIRKHADDGEKIEEAVSDRLRRVNPSRPLLKKLYAHFKESFDDANREKDNPEVAKTIAPLVLAVNILASFSGNAKVARINASTTRRNAKAASKMTYKVMDASTNTASVSPAQIPGSKQAIIYNTKNRKVIIYNADGSGELGIRGTKITGYDDGTSFAKTLRKPKEVLPMLRDAINTRRVDIVMGYIKGKTHKVNGKIGKDMVILKIFK